MTRKYLQGQLACPRVCPSAWVEIDTMASASIENNEEANELVSSISKKNINRYSLISY
jgi:hypothetical protein